MSRLVVTCLSLVFLISLMLEAAYAQRPAVPRPGSAGQKNQDDDKKKEEPPLPSDRRLLALHLEFVNEAAKLASEYENKQDFDKAKVVYQEILKLVPSYEPAKLKLNELMQREATASRATFDVDAREEWQNTGVTVEKGKPITIRATGTWTFTLTAELGPDGMTIPKELRDYNLGCLMAVIDTGEPMDYKPFVVGAQKSFVPDKSGRLYLRMYDTDPKDNKGSLKVEFIGSFEKR